MMLKGGLLTILLATSVCRGEFYDPSTLGQIITTEASQISPTELDTLGLVDINGQPTTNITQAKGCTTGTCRRFSKGQAGWTFISSNDFVPLFGTWLVPWLALTAQMPYETKSKALNLMSLLLALGSPLLATYSLSLTVLNARWINNAFKKELDAWRKLVREGAPREIPKAIKCMRWSMIETQHVPIRIHRGEHNAFAQLIVRPENATWWKKLKKGLLSTKREKTLSLFMQLGWVIVSQVLSIVQFFTTGTDDSTVVLGQAINALWTWMLPIVWGWVFVGTQNTAQSIPDAIENAPAPMVTGAEGVQQRRFEILEDRTKHNDSLWLGFSIEGWEKQPGPLFIYSRVASHMTACNLLRKASAGLRNCVYAMPTVLEHPKSWEAEILPMAAQVEGYVLGRSAEQHPDFSTYSGAPKDISINFFLAACIGLLLQWGTAGSAIMIAYMTPVVGLGCDSGAYLLYAVIATIVWSLLVLSASLSQFWSVRNEKSGAQSGILVWIGAFAVLTRLAGNTLAVLNALFVLSFSILQLTNVYDNCWCSSSALQWGPNHIVLLWATPADYFALSSPYWIGGTFISITCAAFCTAFFMLSKGDDLFNMTAL